MDVSENSGTPKSSILIGFSTINHPFWGSPIFGNTHIFWGEPRVMFAQLLQIMKDPQPLTCFFLFDQESTKRSWKTIVSSPTSIVSWQFSVCLWFVYLSIYLFILYKSKMVPVCVCLRKNKPSSSPSPAIFDKNTMDHQKTAPLGTLTMISGASGSTAFFLQPYEVIRINDRMGGRMFFFVRQVGGKDRFF